MAKYSFNDIGEIEIDFNGIKPDYDTRTKMKSVKYRWNPNKMIWWANKNDETIAMAKEICGEGAGSRCCYSNTVDGFLEETKGNWIKLMRSTFSDEYMMSLGSAQIHAWEDCFDVLQEQLPYFNEKAPGFNIIFEYALPYESGRRPDVILVSEEFVLILEFKMKSEILEADVDQIRAYARDIREYHFESRNKDIIPFLVLTHTDGIRTDLSHEYGSLVVCSKEWLATVLGHAICGNDIGNCHEQTITSCDAEKWMASKYEPLPTIVDAARKLMKHEELPNIKQVHTSTVIPQAIEFLTKITKEAKQKQEHVLAMVTGVPGAGKTYLGLQYVYDICDSNEHVNSVYLSGNGPLVQVLQDALQSKAFVKSIHTVVNEYMDRKAGDFSKNVIVFDEGQRAWNKERMSKRHRNDPRSEPDVMVDLCTEQLDWCVLLILVGEGQEINTGENSGMVQWNTAIERSKCDWKIVCPNKLAGIFEGQDVVTSDVLNLNVSLRTHTAGEVSNFINQLIAGNIVAARKIADGITDYNMYVTRDLEKAKQYCQNVYEGRDNARYGLIASSKAYNLSSYGMKPIFSKNKTYIAHWFNRPTNDSRSCCALKTTISEFDCQGLEIDMSIVGWGTDMKWEGSGWSRFEASEADDSEKNVYRINSYRVLLTRGRDGFIAFVPPIAELDATFDALVRAGIKELN